MNHLVDTHAHLYYPMFDRDRADMLQRAKNNGVTQIYLPNVDAESMEMLVALVQQYPQQCKGMAGVHPCSVKADFETELQQAHQELEQTRIPIYGIGETGLDYYWDISNVEQQKDLFRKQIRIASQLKLPVIVHTRDSTDDAITLLKEEYEQYPVRAHFHCFSGTLEQLSDCLSIPDSHVSFCGNITYKKSILDEVISAAPIDRLLSETDSPFLPPMPYRGKKNEPSFMINTLEKISNVKAIPMIELIGAVSKNAEQFFAL